MDWSNERYVRLYTRDTDDWLALKWEAKATFVLMLRKVDRSGFMATKRGVIGVAAQTGLPLEVVSAGVPDLLRDGSVTECDGGYLLPNYIEAQEAPQSDAQRARESRERRRDRKKSHNEVSASHKVTEPSHAVTPRHTLSLQPSQPVQPSELPEPASNSEAATALTVAANRALQDRFGEQTSPLIASGGKAYALAAVVLAAPIPLDFALRSVVRQVATLDRPVRSMSYFRAGILDDWQQEQERVAAVGSDPIQPLEGRRSGRREISLIEALLRPGGAA